LKNGTTPLPLIGIDANFLMFLTQDKSDVIHSITENITNIDAMTKQSRAVTNPPNKKILSMSSPF
jgi:hypothetical protein